MVMMKWDEQYHITSDQYERLRDAYDQAVEAHKTARMTDLRDADTGELMWQGRMSEIISFREKKINKNPLGWYCDVGRLHKEREECNCLNSGIYPYEFLERRIKLFPDIYYQQDLSEDQRREVIKNWQDRRLPVES